MKDVGEPGMRREDGDAAAPDDEAMAVELRNSTTG
jgi:hypothetical protein